jgi:endonuclease/exonuclease/phosphatase family metal-dependent hydrolase
MAKTPPGEFEWDAFIGRSLGYLCLHLADMRSKTRLEQADFLMQWGLPRREAAMIVGTTDESLAELSRQRTKRAAKVAK